MFKLQCLFIWLILCPIKYLLIILDVPKEANTCTKQRASLQPEAWLCPLIFYFSRSPFPPAHNPQWSLPMASAIESQRPRVHEEVERMAHTSISNLLSFIPRIICWQPGPRSNSGLWPELHKVLHGNDSSSVSLWAPTRYYPFTYIFTCTYIPQAVTTAFRHKTSRNPAEKIKSPQGTLFAEMWPYLPLRQNVISLVGHIWL